MEDIVKLSSDKKLYISYYLLRSVFDKTVTAYIPVENHQVLLRELINLEEALRITEIERKDMGEKELAEVEYVIKNQY